MVIGLVNFGSGKNTLLSPLKKLEHMVWLWLRKVVTERSLEKKESPSPKSKTHVLLHHACTIPGGGGVNQKKKI